MLKGEKTRKSESLAAELIIDISIQQEQVKSIQDTTSIEWLRITLIVCIAKVKVKVQAFSIALPSSLYNLGHDIIQVTDWLADWRLLNLPPAYRYVRA